MQNLTKQPQSTQQEGINSEQIEFSEEFKDQIVEQSPKGRFIRFNEELGFGAYKTVYKGYDNDSGCEIAWNVIKLQGQSSAERNRISEEISLLKNLNHKNIINFINAWINKAKNEVIFITECLSGGSLKKYLNRIRKPRLKIIKMWCKQILAGLQYLHEQEPHPIIHRDIKCENIFVNTVNNEIRIGDLGLALTLKQDFTTSVLGTPEFMAPEIYEEKYGTSVDIYAFGMCLLEMATLQTPYKECTSPAQVYKKVMAGIHPLSLQLIQSEEIKQFILKCIQRQTDRPSAAQLLQDDFFKESEIDNFPISLSTDKIDKANTQASNLQYPVQDQTNPQGKNKSPQRDEKMIPEKTLQQQQGDPKPKEISQDQIGKKEPSSQQTLPQQQSPQEEKPKKQQQSSSEIARSQQQPKQLDKQDSERKPENITQQAAKPLPTANTQEKITECRTPPKLQGTFQKSQEKIKQQTQTDNKEVVMPQQLAAERDHPRTESLTSSKREHTQSSQSSSSCSSCGSRQGAASNQATENLPQFVRNISDNLSRNVPAGQVSLSSISNRMSEISDAGSIQLMQQTNQQLKPQSQQIQSAKSEELCLNSETLPENLHQTKAISQQSNDAFSNNQPKDPFKIAPNISSNSNITIDNAKLAGGQQHREVRDVQILQKQPSNRIGKIGMQDGESSESSVNPESNASLDQMTASQYQAIEAVNLKDDEKILNGNNSYFPSNNPNNSIQQSPQFSEQQQVQKQQKTTCVSPIVQQNLVDGLDIECQQHQLSIVKSLSEPNFNDNNEQQQSRLEEQQQQGQYDDVPEQEERPYILEVVEEKELKNQKFRIKFQFKTHQLLETFEIDNAREDFSQESIFQIALEKATQFNILQHLELFEYDLYNLVCERYNDYHSHVSQSRLISTEDQQSESGSGGSAHISQVSEFNVQEIFVRHYQNYMAEIEEYLKTESLLGLKVRQQKESIQLNRFHLNQQENQLDFEQKMQLNFKSPQVNQQIYGNSANNPNNNSSSILSPQQGILEGAAATVVDRHQTNHNNIPNGAFASSPSDHLLAKPPSNSNNFDPFLNSHQSSSNNNNYLNFNNSSNLVSNHQVKKSGNHASFSYSMTSSSNNNNNHINHHIGSKNLHGQKVNYSVTPIAAGSAYHNQTFSPKAHISGNNDPDSYGDDPDNNNNYDYDAIDPYYHNTHHIQKDSNNINFKQKHPFATSQQLFQQQQIPYSPQFNNKYNNTPSQPQPDNHFVKHQLSGSHQQQFISYSQQVISSNQQINSYKADNLMQGNNSLAASSHKNSNCIQKQSSLQVGAQPDKQLSKQLKNSQYSSEDSLMTTKQTQQNSKGMKEQSRQMTKGESPIAKALSTEELSALNNHNININGNAYQQSSFAPSQKSVNAKTTPSESNIQDQSTAQPQQLLQQFAQTSDQAQLQYQSTQQQQQQQQQQSSSSSSQKQIVSQQLNPKCLETSPELYQKDWKSTQQEQPTQPISKGQQQQQQQSTIQDLSGSGSTTPQVPNQQALGSQQRLPQDNMQVNQQLPVQLPQQKLPLKQQQPQQNQQQTLLLGSHVGDSLPSNVPVLVPPVQFQSSNKQSSQESNSNQYTPSQPQQSPVPSSLPQQQDQQQSQQQKKPQLSQQQLSPSQLNQQKAKDSQQQQQSVSQSQNKQQPTSSQQQSNVSQASFPLTNLPSPSPQTPHSSNMPCTNINNNNNTLKSQGQQPNPQQGNIIIPPASNKATGASQLPAAASNQSSANSKSSPTKQEDEIKRIIADTKILVDKGVQSNRIERQNTEKQPPKDDADVRVLQRSLKLLLPQCEILENGHFGNYTETMVKLYQKQHNIACTGVVDNQLWKLINCELEGVLSTLEKKNGVSGAASLSSSTATTKKQLIKEFQSQLSKETLSNFESALLKDFNLTDSNNML